MISDVTWLSRTFFTDRVGTANNVIACVCPSGRLSVSTLTFKHLHVYRSTGILGKGQRSRSNFSGVISETLRQFTPLSDISQGSVATHLMCGGILVIVSTNFFLILTVKQFLKSVNI